LVVAVRSFLQVATLFLTPSLLLVAVKAHQVMPRLQTQRAVAVAVVVRVSALLREPLAILRLFRRLKVMLVVLP
jgi:hypothetical protein